MLSTLSFVALAAATALTTAPTLVQAKYECDTSLGTYYPYCINVPDGASSSDKLPTIVFLSGSGARGPASNVKSLVSNLPFVHTTLFLPLPPSHRFHSVLWPRHLSLLHNSAYVQAVYARCGPKRQIRAMRQGICALTHSEAASYCSQRVQPCFHALFLLARRSWPIIRSVHATSKAFKTVY